MNQPRTFWAPDPVQRFGMALDEHGDIQLTTPLDAPAPAPNENDQPLYDLVTCEGCEMLISADEMADDTPDDIILCKDCWAEYIDLARDALRVIRDGRRL